MSLSVLYVLDKVFVNNVGTDDALHKFKEFSKLFEKNKRLTRNENRLMEFVVNFKK